MSELWRKKYLYEGSDDNGYLEHFGIKGMKWGVRRYQNPDGSLTEAGKKRYQKYVNKIEKLNKQHEKEDRGPQKKLSKYSEKARKIDKKSSKQKRAVDYTRTANGELAVVYDKTNKLKRKSAKLANKIARAQRKLYEIDKYYNNRIDKIKRKQYRITHSEISDMSWIESMYRNLDDMSEAEQKAFYCMVDDMYPEVNEEPIEITDEDFYEDSNESFDSDDTDEDSDDGDGDGE